MKKGIVKRAIKKIFHKDTFRWRVIASSLIVIGAIGFSVFVFDYSARASCVEPCLSVNPTSFSFAGVQGGSNPSSQTLTVNEAYLGGMRWSTSVTQPWLSVAPAAGGTAPGPWSITLDVSVDTAGLLAGTYTGKIYVCDPNYVDICDPSDPGFSTPGVADTVDVALDVTPPPFTCNSIGNPPSQTVVLTNSGASTLNWNAAGDRSWLSVSPANGTLAAGASTNLIVDFDKSGYTPGTFTGNVIVSGNAQSKSAPVTFTITP